tara:strand:+ start:198 stop:782 length:585 start_codon:yes stop_codon:yes gene_type:complete
MAITNDRELRDASRKAGELLQEIQDYCGRKLKDDAKVRFPRGYLRTASSQRERLSFVADEDLKSNLAYTLILSDTILWQLKRTDISGTAKEMLIKLFIFIGGTLIESITKDYLKGLCGKNFKKRTQYLVDKGVIDSTLQSDIDWIWDTRNNMHLFLLDTKEYENEYNSQSHVRCAKAFKQLIEKLKAKGRLRAS